MEIDNKLNDLFKTKKESKKVVIKKDGTSETISVTQKDTTDFEIKNLEFNLNKHLREKQKLRYKKVTISENNNMYNEAELSKCIDNEIFEKFKDKKWSSIPLYMKWNMIQQYLEDNHLDDKQKSKYKNKLSTNKLDVTYDHNEQKIVNVEILD